MKAFDGTWGSGSLASDYINYSESLYDPDNFPPVKSPLSAAMTRRTEWSGYFHFENVQILEDNPYWFVDIKVLKGGLTNAERKAAEQVASNFNPEQS